MRLGSIFYGYLDHFYAQPRKITKHVRPKKFVIFQEMEISSSNMEKILYFLKTKHLLYFRKRNPALFSPRLKNKKVHPEKISYTLQETQTPKKLIIFFQKKAAFIFRVMKTQTNSLYFTKWNFSYISESTFPSSKRFVYFGK